MKNITKLFFTLAVAAVALISCNDNDTYADQLERERNAINDFIKNKKIKVISEAEFYAKDSVTDTAANEYVYFGNTAYTCRLSTRDAARR